MAMTVFALGAPIGAWLGSDIAGLVSTQHGWRAAFLVLGIPGVILALIIMVTIKEPARGRLDAVVEDEAPIRQMIAFNLSRAGFEVEEAEEGAKHRISAG